MLPQEEIIRVDTFVGSDKIQEEVDDEDDDHEVSLK